MSLFLPSLVFVFQYVNSFLIYLEAINSFLISISINVEEYFFSLSNSLIGLLLKNRKDTVCLHTQKAEMQHFLDWKVSSEMWKCQTCVNRKIQRSSIKGLYTVKLWNMKRLAGESRRGGWKLKRGYKWGKCHWLAIMQFKNRNHIHVCII